MNYLPWALLALATYTLVAPLMSFATTGNSPVPSNVATLMANSVLVLVTLGLVAFTNENPVGYLTHPKSPYIYAAGFCLSIGILAYYRALSMGAVSVVTPVFGMFLVTSSVLGIVFLNESFTARKAAGIALAVVAVYLVSVD
jgi:transporter family protein